MSDQWTFVSKFMAGLLDQDIGGDETMWMFRYENYETGERILVMAHDGDEAGEKIAEGNYKDD